MNTVKKGSKGEDVKLLQMCMGCVPDGDFGPTTEKLVKQWQKEHGLVEDGIVGPKTWEAMLSSSHISGLNIQYEPISKHITKKSGRAIKYLVIHYTAGGNSKNGAAEKNRNVFLDREASADFCVDDETIIQVNPDIRNYYCWAVGDGKGKYGIYNKDCVSIEICSNLKKGTTASVPNHSGWYFTDESLEKAVALCRYIMSVYKIPIERVIRHYDATKKPCPGIIGWNTATLYNEVSGKALGSKNNEEEWKKFKNRIKG